MVNGEWWMVNLAINCQLSTVNYQLFKASLTMGIDIHFDRLFLD